MHHNDIRIRGRQPLHQLALVRDIGSKKPAVAFVFTVIGDSAALRTESADEVEVSFTGGHELIPEDCTPTALSGVSSVVIKGEEKGEITGEPVMLSPRGIILVAAMVGETRAPRTARRVVVRANNMVAVILVGMSCELCN